MQMSAFGYVVANGVKDPHADNASYMRFQFAKKLDEFRGHGGNPDAARLLAQYVEASAHLLERCSSAVLCHNDFHAGNVLVSRTDDRDVRLTGVVDFENVIAGDPLMDLAKTELYAVGDSKPKREGLYGGYGPIARTDAVPTIDLYRAYHAIELWDWLATTGDLTGNLARIANAEIEKVIQRSRG